MKEQKVWFGLGAIFAIMAIVALGEGLYIYFRYMQAAPAAQTAFEEEYYEERYYSDEYANEQWPMHGSEDREHPDWELYENHEFGFTFEYPEGYKVQSTGLEIDPNHDVADQIHREGSMIVNLYKTTDGYQGQTAPGFRVDVLSIDEEAGIVGLESAVATYYGANNPDVYDISQININGTTWAKVRFRYIPMDAILMTERNGLLYTLHYRQLHVDEPTITEIASTFKFEDRPVYVHLFYPNGNEIWRPGQKYPVKFQAENWYGQVNIELRRYHPVGSPKRGLSSMSLMATTYEKNGSEYIEAPEWMGLGGYYKVRVCAGRCPEHEGDTDHTAESEEYFSIQY